MIQINLIPDVKREYLKARRMRDVAISFSILVSIVAIGLVVVLAMFLSIQAAREFFADQNIDTEYEKLSSVEDLGNMVTIENQLSLISAQHHSKTITSRLFSVLQAINPATPNNVQFTSVTLIPEDGRLNFEGLADGGYNAVETLVKTIQNTEVRYTTGSDSTIISEQFSTDVELGQTSYGTSADNKKVLSFKMSVYCLQDLFTNRIKDVNVVGPTKTTDVTDSKLRVPASLFSVPVVDEEERQ